MLNKEYLNECFDADFEAGTLTWKKRPLNHFKNKNAFNVFNAQQAGKTVNTIARFYKTVGINYKRYQQHTILFIMYHGYKPFQIDHIDGNKLNNSISNLRECTSSQNNMNSSLQKNSTTKLKGVSFNKRKNKFEASIMANYVKYRLGLFDTAEDAKRAYNAAANKLHGCFAKI
jgi:hypothetical protein